MKGGHDMSKTTLYGEIAKAKQKAFFAKNAEVATHIWSEIEAAFRAIDLFELEVIKSVTITVTEKGDCLELSKTLKKYFGSNPYESHEENLKNIVLSERRLQNIDETMSEVQDKAREEGLETQANFNNFTKERSWDFTVML